MFPDCTPDQHIRHQGPAGAPALRGYDAFIDQNSTLLYFHSYALGIKLWIAVVDVDLPIRQGLHFVNRLVHALGGFVTLFDILRESEAPVAVVMAGVKAPAIWIGAVPAGDSRTLRVEPFTNLAPAMMLGILKKWLPAFQELADEYENKNMQTRKLVTAIAKVTSGNLRRLRYFADLAEAVSIEQLRDMHALEAILSKITLTPGAK